MWRADVNNRHGCYKRVRLLLIISIENITTTLNTPLLLNGCIKQHRPTTINNTHMQPIIISALHCNLTSSHFDTIGYYRWAIRPSKDLRPCSVILLFNYSWFRCMITGSCRIGAMIPPRPKQHAFNYPRANTSASSLSCPNPRNSPVGTRNNCHNFTKDNKLPDHVLFIANHTLIHNELEAQIRTAHCQSAAVQA